MNQAYSIKKQEFIEELNGTGYILEHKKTKAKVVVVSNDDENKVFNIGFRTPPKDDTGVPHITEHSVLCGSKEFPLKDPFVELVKGSLNTFLNAMTYPDKTVYPVASCNDKDFHNLMHVYLDAVFYPNIYTNPKILKQEGWHYELYKPEDELIYNGVVYNEMKGVFSSPDQQLMRTIQKTLYPDTPYGVESGGDPIAIPELTQEAFEEFHSTYYHPSNSYIYLYGNMDVDEYLTFIDEKYLSDFEYLAVDSEIPEQKAFDKAVRVEDYYSLSESEEEKDNTYLSYNVVVGDSLDRNLYLAFQILEYVLLSAPGAPLEEALIKKGIGKDISSTYDNGIKQPFFSIIAQNANDDQEEAFVKTIEESIKDLIANGISKRALEAALTYYEFKYKESNFGRFPKGLIHGLNMFDSWLYDEEKPFVHIKTNDTFENIRNLLKEGYFEQLLQTYFLDNPHKAIVVLKPKKGLNEQREAKIKEELAAYKDSLSDEEIEAIITATKELKAYQDAPTPKEDLEKIPLLSLEDISKEGKKLYNEEMEIAGAKTVHHNIFTNGISYMKFHFNLRNLPLDMIPYVSLLVDFYKDVNTKNYTYNELANEININTGGIGCSYSVIPLHDEKRSLYPFWHISAKCFYNKIPEAFRLVKEIFFHSDFTDKARLKEIIAREHTQMKSSFSAGGHKTAASRAASYVSAGALYKEYMEGIEFYEFLDDLLKNFDEKADDLIKKLYEAMEYVFGKEQFIFSVTDDQDAKEVFESELSDFMNCLFESKDVETELDEIKPAVRNEGFATASQVQYVATAGNFVDAGCSYHAALKVLNVMFSYDYLWENVRVKGGAYGCMCTFTRSGDGYFVSYRDPNLMETYDIFKKAKDYVANFDADDRTMLKYIIGAISNMDVPMEPSTKGSFSFMAYLSGLTEEMLQKDRDQVLSCTQEVIRSLAPIIEAVANQGILCAVGGEAKMKENADAFGEIRHVF
ncbi:MAG: insulinase family protein [Lachnospiraceae bacterium]|nr:insulinase family protein [Lachnospiraceae bacterium]